MKKSFFKCAIIALSLAAFQACNETVDQDILDPDVPLNADTLTAPEAAAEAGQEASTAIDYSLIEQAIVKR
ncbi:MAG: hypothetical protein KBT08_01390 [Bacteroidales bacterium]|nr:hypothetical protein [Candidatus Cryptobacteroides onthequi]